MDVNYFLFRQQVERSRAERARCIASRMAHHEMADAYDRLIAGARVVPVAACPEPA